MDSKTDAGCVNSRSVFVDEKATLRYLLFVEGFLDVQ